MKSYAANKESFTFLQHFLYTLFCLKITQFRGIFVRNYETVRDNYVSQISLKLVNFSRKMEFSFQLFSLFFVFSGRATPSGY
jgi:hypothetical protein